jgi:hypothetical protein
MQEVAYLRTGVYILGILFEIIDRASVAKIAKHIFFYVMIKNMNLNMNMNDNEDNHEHYNFWELLIVTFLGEFSNAWEEILFVTFSVKPVIIGSELIIIP